MVSSLADDLERRVGGLLARVPGYRGYRSKEDRRDADRRLREHIATSFGQQADRVERIARDVADRRRLNEIGPVDDLARAIRHLADRIRTATYGYGGLFGDRDVDAAALDQIRLFDESLLGGVDELQEPLGQLEAAHAANGDLATPARAASAVVRALDARFDLRGEVVETGKPAAEESVLRALGPGPGAAADQPHRAYGLQLGDALAILGDDFLVDGQIALSGADDLRLFRLGGGTAAEEWLLVPRQPALGLARLQPVAAPPTPPVSGQTTLDGVSYTIQSAGSGDGEVTGTGGGSGLRPVRFALLAGADDPAARALVLDWGTDRQAFAGRDVHPNDVEVFGRPTGTIN